MLQFSQEQIISFRERIKTEPEILELVSVDKEYVKEYMKVPKEGIAGWTGHLVCPEHSMRLTVDMKEPTKCVCPCDGKVFTEEPYKGAWWTVQGGHISLACKKTAYRYMLLEDPEDLTFVKDILMEYATCYPNYKPHGNIPYNKPGKYYAQSITDAGWLSGIMQAYDVIREFISEEESNHIDNGLIRCAAEYLIEHRTNQLHNHEVIIDCAIAIAGLLLKEDRYINFAIYEAYGLKYQLEKGLLEDGFWFEGTVGYHLFTFSHYIQYEAFARRTKHSFFKDPYFIEALKFPLHLLQPNGNVTPLNDSNAFGLNGKENCYELAYLQTKDLDFVKLLKLVYKQGERPNIHSVFFGVKDLPKVEENNILEDYHDKTKKGSGLTLLHGKNQSFLLVKHSPYGGEHDHYDRLGIHFMAYGKNIVPDIGTCPYGAPLHYAYYKNTASHNTVCINGENQPPTNCHTRKYKKTSDYTLLDVEAKWDGNAEKLDSFTIKQWSDEAYKDVYMRRVIYWFEDFFVDMFYVKAPTQKTIDWAVHVRGNQMEASNWEEAPKLSDSGPQSFLHNVYEYKGAEPLCNFELGDDVMLNIQSLSSNKCKHFKALGPDNPSVSDISYLIERIVGEEALYINIFCPYRVGEPIIRSIERRGTEKEVFIQIETKNKGTFSFQNSFAE